MKIFRGVLMLLLASVILSCDAPRLNPFDPLGQERKLAQFDGYVQTYEQPRQPIAKVTVTWKNQNVTVQTDSLGYFKIVDVPRINGEVYFEKTGFSKDTVTIDWKNQNYKRIDNVLLSYTFGDIDGFIQNIDQQAVSKVKVFWKNEKITVETDANGYYKIENVPIKNGFIFFEKENFEKDSLLVEWEGIGSKSIRLDSKTLKYNIGDLEGTVQTTDTQPQPLENVHVRWKGLNTISVTNAKGEYKFAQIPIKNGILYFDKDGFKSDSLTVQWSLLKTKTIPAFQLKYIYGDLGGTVRTYDTNIPIPKVYVRWKGLTTIAETNDQGYFLFKNIPIQSGELYFEKEGFQKDTVLVDWESSKTKNIEATLKYSSGLISGRVLTEKLPRQPIYKAKVYWKNQNILKETDGNGSYSIDNVKNEDGYLYIEKSGYSPDSIFIHWGDQKEIKDKDVYLNAIPTLEDVQIFSVRINKFPAEFKTTRLTVQAKISDAENDVDSVFVQCRQLNVFAPLEYNISTKSFEKEFNSVDFKVAYVDDIIGKNLEIVAKDKLGQKFTVGSSTLKRILTQEIETHSPKEAITVSSRPTFSWARFLGDYNFKYYIEVLRDEIPATSVWKSSYFSKSAIEYTLTTDLSTGDYFWRLWVVDDFQNSACSKPSTFKVQ
jgi:phosphatidate phosphatase APP1